MKKKKKKKKPEKKEEKKKRIPISLSYPPTTAPGVRVSVFSPLLTSALLQPRTLKKVSAWVLGAGCLGGRIGYSQGGIVSCKEMFLTRT